MTEPVDDGVDYRRLAEESLRLMNEMDGTPEEEASDPEPVFEDPNEILRRGQEEVAAIAAQRNAARNASIDAGNAERRRRMGYLQDERQMMNDRHGRLNQSRDELGRFMSVEDREAMRDEAWAAARAEKAEWNAKRSALRAEAEAAAATSRAEDAVEAAAINFAADVVMDRALDAKEKIQGEIDRRMAEAREMSRVTETALRVESTCEMRDAIRYRRIDDEAIDRDLLDADPSAANGRVLAAAVTIRERADATTLLPEFVGRPRSAFWGADGETPEFLVAVVDQLRAPEPVEATQQHTEEFLRLQEMAEPTDADIRSVRAEVNRGVGDIRKRTGMSASAARLLSEELVFAAAARLWAERAGEPVVEVAVDELVARLLGGLPADTDMESEHEEPASRDSVGRPA